MRGDRPGTDASSDRRAPAGTLAMKCTLVLQTWFFFAEGLRNGGLGRWQFGRGEPSGPTLGAPMTNGCTGAAEEGLSRIIPRRANPSLGLPAHAARATGRRRRKASSRWMVGLVSRTPSPLLGESGLAAVSPEHVARGPSASTLVRGSSHHGAQNAKRVAALVVLRGSRLVSVLVRRSFTGCRSR